jgi:hypothetical protein
MRKTLLILFLIILSTTQAYGWSCAGHTSIAQGVSTNTDACVTDARRSFKHYVNNERGKTITANDFSNGDTENGDLYKKIYDLSKIVFDKKPLSTTDREDLIHLLGDLSNPMHNVIYEGYNKKHHREYDNTDLGKSCVKVNSVDSIQNHAQFIDVAVKLANDAKRIGYSDIDADSMADTQNEACSLASQSATMIKAIVIRINMN